MTDTGGHIETNRRIEREDREHTDRGGGVVWPGGGSAVPPVPAGSIVMWGGAGTPARWLPCDGSAVSRTTYAKLFAAIDTTYGNGNGSTTFNLPDLRARFAVGAYGSGDVELGSDEGDAVGDREAHVIDPKTDEPGAHQHNIGPVSTNASLLSGTTNTSGENSHTHPIGDGANAQTAGADSAIHPAGTGAGTEHGHTVDKSGFNHAHDIDSFLSGAEGNHYHSMDGNWPPYLAVSFIIKT